MFARCSVRGTQRGTVQAQHLRVDAAGADAAFNAKVAVLLRAQCHQHDTSQSHVTRHTSHVTRHTSHVNAIRFTSPHFAPLQTTSARAQTQAQPQAHVKAHTANNRHIKQKAHQTKGTSNNRHIKQKAHQTTGTSNSRHIKQQAHQTPHTSCCARANSRLSSAGPSRCRTPPSSQRGQALKVEVTNGEAHVARHHTSHVTRHTSHVTRHTSHVTRHASPVLEHILPERMP